jgi:hypothetical protein
MLLEYVLDPHEAVVRSEVEVEAAERRSVRAPARSRDDIMGLDSSRSPIADGRMSSLPSRARSWMAVVSTSLSTAEKPRS